MTWHKCKVVKVCVAADGTETASPVVQIMLTDQEGAFRESWFFAAQDSKSEMLNVALMAIGANATVNAMVTKPHPKNSPQTQITRIEIFSNAGATAADVSTSEPAPAAAVVTAAFRIPGFPFPAQPPDLTVHNLTVTGDIFLTYHASNPGEVLGSEAEKL
jgi:hypothetical protein